jgi:hypothetical protein
MYFEPMPKTSKRDKIGAIIKAPFRMAKYLVKLSFALVFLGLTALCMFGLVAFVLNVASYHVVAPAITAVGEPIIDTPIEMAHPYGTNRPIQHR